MDATRSIQPPLITLIIPVYNVILYLRQCLDSVVAQTYPNLEILIVDDGSTDGSGAVCDAYALRDERITVFHTENGGLSAARNYALDRTHGAYIAFLDSDDWMDADTLERMMSASLSYDADIVTCRHSSVWKTHEEFPHTQDSCLNVLEGNAIQEVLPSMNYVGNVAWNKLYRAELFSEIRFPCGRVYEDIATTYQVAALSERIINLPDVLIHYRIRKSSISRSRSMKNLTDHWWAHQKRYQDLREKCPAQSGILVRNCVFAAVRFWFWYFDCTGAEKAGASELIKEMQAFAREHFREVMRDRDAGRRIKLLCPCLLLNHLFFFRLLYALNMAYQRLRKSGDPFP